MTYVLGVDEAGRGPLAGPLAVGFAKVPEGFDTLAAFPGLADSKRLSERKREELFALLESSSLAYRVEWVSAAEIDERGLTASIRDAVARGASLLMTPEEGEVLLDGGLMAPDSYRQRTIVRGDQTETSIMLAAIAAKVLRDRHMAELAATYPLYGFDAHKGYGTKAHMDAIRTHGPCLEHRRLFLRKLEQ